MSKTSRKLAPPLEHLEQQAVIDWCNAHHVKWPCLKFIYAIPNQGSSSPVRGKRMKAEGLKAGVPDLCLPYVYSTVHFYGERQELKWHHGLYIEMKRKPNKPSEDQERWIAHLRGAGYSVHVAYSADEAIKIIKDYLE